MKNQDLDLYTDYLLSSFGKTTATGLSSMLDGEVSHDRITRFLSRNEFTSKDLWLHVKSSVREVEEKDEGFLIFDDTIQEKAWTDENEIMCWHYDHCSGRTVRGLNILNALYLCTDISIPVAFEVVRKPIQFCDLKTKKVKRKNEVTKNELLRSIFSTCIANHLCFKYVLLDSWFASVENFKFIREKDKEFVAAIKSNRLIALSKEDKLNGRYVSVDSLEISDKESLCCWLKDYDEEVLLVRRIFTNKDASTGILNLVCSDLKCSGHEASAIYEKRWKVEEFHKSLKSNASLAKSPTRTITTQKNHIFASFCAVFKLECLKLKHKANHFALRAKLLIKATQQAYLELKNLQSA